jgi:hypothetical protein
MDESDLPQDPLFTLERKIARRADELSRLRNTAAEFTLVNWLEAELEMCRDLDWNLAIFPEGST